MWLETVVGTVLVLPKRPRFRLAVWHFSRPPSHNSQVRKSIAGYSATPDFCVSSSVSRCNRSSLAVPLSTLRCAPPTRARAQTRLHSVWRTAASKTNPVWHAIGTCKQPMSTTETFPIRSQRLITNLRSVKCLSGSLMLCFTLRRITLLPKRYYGSVTLLA